MTADEFAAQLPAPVGTFTPTGLPAANGADLPAKLDPYRLLSPAPSPLANYDFGALPPGKTASFLDAVALNYRPNFPVLANLQPAALTDGRSEANSVSHAHHSIWIGGPLVEDRGKKEEIMQTLEFHKTNNPTWSVNLWTDVSRAELHAAAPGSDMGKFKTWAEDNSINLINVDEVFGGATPMSLEGHFKLEENKKGTGYAAASDILRLEALKRFGGIYTDGDDRVQVEFPAVAANLPADTGVLAATVNASISNCVFCAAKGSSGVDAMLQRVGANYALSRDEFLASIRLTPANFAAMSPAQKAKIGEGEDASRSEVINRSGPTVAKQILQTVDNRNNIPAEQLEVDTANTSWTNRTRMPGTPDVRQLPAALATPPTPLANRKAQASQDAQLARQSAPTLPAAFNPTPQELQTCSLAVQKCVTTLTYQLLNEAKLDANAGAQGVLDLNHAMPHLRGLTDEQKLVVMHGVVKTLATQPFQPVAQTAFAVKLPAGMALPEATLDQLFNAANFPNVRMNTAAVQDAALRGDLYFLEYARAQNQLPPLDAQAGVFLEAGRFKAMTGGISIGENQGGRLTLMEAALKGGSQNAVLFLLDQPGADVTVQANPQWATMAGKYGQPQTLLDLASGGSAVNHASTASGDYNSPSLVLLHTTLEANIPQADLAALPATRVAVLQHVVDGLNAQAPGAGLRAAGEQLAVHLVDHRDFATLEHFNSRGLTLAHVPQNKLADLAKSIGQSATTQENAAFAVRFANSNGPAPRELTAGMAQEAMTQKNAFLLASILKQAQPAIPYADHLATAEKDIAKARYPDTAAIKDDYLNAHPIQNANQARDLIHKAIAYTEGHLDNAQGGRAARVAGWNQLMTQINAQFGGDPRIGAAATQAQNRLQVLSETHTSVRDTLAKRAATVRRTIANNLPGHQPGGLGN